MPRLLPVRKQERSDRLLSVRLEESLYLALAERAEDVGITVSEAIRQLVRQLVAETEDRPKVPEGEAE